MIPTVGRIVHYVLSANDLGGSVRPGRVGAHRPAIVLHCWSDTCVQLQVFLDSTNDSPWGDCTMWATSVPQDEASKPGRTWHWPEREED